MTVTTSPGIATIAGTAGGGMGRAPQDVRARLTDAAAALTELNDNHPVEIRVNSDGQSGGAWLITSPGSRSMWANAEVGINVHATTDTYTAHVRVVALRENSPLRPDLTGYTFDPSRDRHTDPLYGSDARVTHTGTLPDVIAFLRAHTRPAADVAATLNTHLATARAHRDANAWWVILVDTDEARYLTVARRTPSADTWVGEPSSDALEGYAATTPLLRGATTSVKRATTTEIASYLELALDAADLEAGRIYNVKVTGLVATKYHSAKVAATSAAVLDAAK